MKHCHPDYLYTAMLLDVEQQELILSRMRGKLPKRFFKGKLTLPEAVALQLEIEDAQLHSLRNKQLQKAETPAERAATIKKKAKPNKAGMAKADPKRVTLESIAPPDWTSESPLQPAL